MPNKYIIFRNILKSDIPFLFAHISAAEYRTEKFFTPDRAMDPTFPCKFAARKIKQKRSLISFGTPRIYNDISGDGSGDRTGTIVSNYRGLRRL